MRAYLPTTLRELAETWSAGAVPAGRVWYAVTPALREWYREGDTEELEYAALTAAAAASLRALAEQADGADGQVPARRAVVAADVPERAVQLLALVEGGAHRAAVRVGAPVPLSALASVHVDDEQAVDDVRAALAALPAADAGDDDAAFVVEAVEGHELLWYATQEIPDLVER